MREGGREGEGERERDRGRESERKGERERGNTTCHPSMKSSCFNYIFFEIGQIPFQPKQEVTRLLIHQ